MTLFSQRRFVMEHT